MDYQSLACRSVVAIFAATCATHPLTAEEFVLGFAGNGLTATAQNTSALLTVGDFTMQLAAAGPAGAWLYESNGAPGLGIGHGTGAALPGGEHEDFDLTNGIAEGIQFSFDHAGLLTGLDFDGVKDENYEYFLLETAGSPNLYFFDSFFGSTADPGLISVPGQVVFLHEFIPPDDGILDLAIPFVAGQQFTITYGQLTVGLPGNGARLQRIVVAPVPEPASWLLAIAGSGLAVARYRRRAN